MLSIFFPKDFNMFDLFEKQVGISVEGAKYFKQMITEGKLSQEALDKLHNIEHQGDEVAHDIIEQLNKSFITPFDREDIHALVKEIDDITDMLHTLTNRMLVYKMTEKNVHLTAFANMIEESVLAVECAVKGLRNTKNYKSVKDACVEVNRLENEGDMMRDKVLAELFETEKDPIKVIKLKDIFQEAETILDICEDVAHMVENILVKQI
ncbi:MAG: hypothetical protein A2252_02430 [Elusimicrobia bacterium RIFOXYA2_FULL_39_19]|nr:MAG: hypothetical protein A2252_02430 [Elusimicrobia bacterium RIFOXYA2_FULL_39_19]